MATPNVNGVNDVMATTIENRSGELADNVTNNNALLKKMSMRGNIRTFSGGTKIFEEMTFAENANQGWYSGYDILPVGVSEVITTAEYEIRQAAVPVVMSGLEMLKNSGKEQIIDLMEGRLKAAEATMSNLVNEGLYSDGEAAGGKQLDGLSDAVSTDPLILGEYGGINPNTLGSEFWQNAVVSAAGVTANNINESWNSLWATLVRGNDRPDLIMVDNYTWSLYVASLQNNQRFTSADTGEYGFSTVKFMDADVCLDGGIYNYNRPNEPTSGVAPASGVGLAYFLNTKYLHYRPHSQRNMVPLAPNKRYATNQDAEVQILAWAGNLTCSGRIFQGRWEASS